MSNCEPVNCRSLPLSDAQLGQHTLRASHATIIRHLMSFYTCHVSTLKWTVPRRCDLSFVEGPAILFGSFCTFVVILQSLSYILPPRAFSFMPSGMAESQSSEEFTGLRQRSASDPNIISTTTPGGGTHVRDDYHAASKRTGVSRFFLRLIRPWTWRRKHRSKKLEETAVSEFQVAHTHHTYEYCLFKCGAERCREN